MNPSKIDIDRNISKLRVNSTEFLNLDESTLVTMLEQVIENIKTISYYWATLSSEKKGILSKSKEGEEWIGGPFACIFAIQYFIETIQNKNDLDKSKYDDTDKSYKVFPTKNIEKLLFPFLESSTGISLRSKSDHRHRRAFSRSYGTILPSSFTRVLSSALVFST